MNKILLYISPQIGFSQAHLAYLNLKEYADKEQKELILQHGGLITHQELQAIDGLIFLGEGAVDPMLETEFKIVRQSMADASENPSDVLAQASPRINNRSEKSVLLKKNDTDSIIKENNNNDMKKIIGVTSCPTGIAHTFMAAEALEDAAKSLGYEVKIETQGSVGAQNTLTDEDIANADCVIIAADVGVDLERFNGKKLYSTGTKKAINDGVAVINTALETASIHGKAVNKEDLLEQTAATKADNTSSLRDVYKHLMTGVSHMLPFVVAGGLLIALGFAFGSFEVGENGIHAYKHEAGSLSQILFNIGEAAFALFVPVLGAYIAYSIGGRAALAAGMVGGYLAAEGGSGFLGAIVIGFVAGYLVLFMTKFIKLPKSLAGLLPILILPLLSVMIVGLLMHYVIGEPVAFINKSLTDWLSSMSSTNGVLLGVIIGAMMAFDLGGPVNKAAYVFATGLLGEGVYAPMAAVMASGMTPPLAIFVASHFFKDRFLEEENEAAKAAGALGLSFISEGAIPFAARDPLHVIPALVAGSAVAGGLSMLFNCTLLAPHGGLFVFFIPNVVGNLIPYVIAIVAGTAVSAMLLGVLKKKVS